MEFIRTIINSDELNNIVLIPDELKHQQVELLILPINKKERKSKADFDPDSYSGILHLSDNDIENNLKSIRDDWERF